MRRVLVVLGLAVASTALTSASVAALGEDTAAAPTAAPASPALALAALDRRIAVLAAEENAAREEIGALGDELAAAHERALTRGRAFYRLTRAGLLPVGEGAGELFAHALRVERLRRILAADLRAEAKLRDRGAELTRILDRLGRDHVALSTQRTAMERARAATEAEAQRQEAFERAFETSGARPLQGDYVAVYGANGGAGVGSGAGSGFAAARGRLLFPLAGRAEVRATKREGTSGPGLEIQSALGAPVRAVYAGRVVFSDRYGPYGRLVIVDHGDHYYSVSGNLADAVVTVGDEVAAGDRLGSAGDEGRGPMVYFEIRHGTETVAPMPWLGL